MQGWTLTPGVKDGHCKGESRGSLCGSPAPQAILLSQMKARALSASAQHLPSLGCTLSRCEAWFIHVRWADLWQGRVGTAGWESQLGCARAWHYLTFEGAVWYTSHQSLMCQDWCSAHQLAITFVYLCTVHSKLGWRKGQAGSCTMLSQQCTGKSLGEGDLRWITMGIAP